MLIQSNQPAASRHKPGLESLLKVIGLDAVYETSAGDMLFGHLSDGRAVEVLDMVGGYGTLLLGHGHPAIIAAMTEFLASGRPNHVQGSVRTGAAKLANLLNVRLAAAAGREYCTVLANSGTEAVEAALKHAMLETAGDTFIALQGGFHGKTLGALQITASPIFRSPFDSRLVRVVRVAPNDIDQLRSALRDMERPAGLIVEPIQGESGVRPLNANYLQSAANLCRDRQIPLIADECQTGLGRTGSFLASHAMGVCPDYVILSKALGGGLAKVSALMIDVRRYRYEFDLLHSSTFADDELSCHVAQKVLELIDDQAIHRCRLLGQSLADQLHDLRERFPTVIKAVRGKGLMIGVEFQRPASQVGFVLKHVTDRRLLGLLVASYLLHEHQIRVAPTLSDPMTIRLQPSLLIQQDQLNRCVEALRDVCEKLYDHDLAALMRPLTLSGRSTESNGTNGTESTNSEALSVESVAPLADLTSTTEIFRYRDCDLPKSTGNMGRNSGAACGHVAWVFHLIDSDDLVHMDPALAALSAQQRARFCDRWSALSSPVVMESIEVQSATNETVRLTPILLPVTSQWMLKRSRDRNRSGARRLVQKAVDVASALGCSVVSLGQFTSIVTRRGTRLNSHGMQITAGSNFSAALVDQAIRAALIKRSMNAADLTLGIVGATGDIGSTCAAMMGPQFRECILVGSGRPGSLDRLNQVARSIPSARVSNCLHSIESAIVVVCATNSTTAPVGIDCLHANAILCDASVPATLQQHITDHRPEITIVPGAIVSLPHREPLAIPGFPLPPGYTYGCMAEGLLLGLDTTPRDPWIGRATAQRAAEISHVADRHGFRVAETAFPLSVADVVR